MVWDQDIHYCAFGQNYHAHSSDTLRTSTPKSCQGPGINCKIVPGFGRREKNICIIDMSDLRS